MVTTVRSLGLNGIAGYEVTAECFLSGGLPAFDIVGLPDAAVREARERVRAAVKNCGAKFPVSRITVTVSGSDKELQQLILQTERLEVTRQVFVLDHDKALERELLLLKVAADVHNRAELREVGSIYKAKIIDLSPDSMVFELIGKPEKIDAFLKMFADYTILELCRTGVTALERGGMHQHIQKPPQEVRDAQLPLPGTTCH
mgnify:CR=1 FL=1